MDTSKLKILLKISFVTAVIVGFWLYEARQPKLKSAADPYRFVKFRGRYWIPMTINGTTRPVLFDTGSSYPFVDSAWLGSDYSDAGSELVRSAFGIRRAAGMIPKRMEFLGKDVSGMKVFSDAGNASMVGGSLIFSSSPMVISRNGVEYPSRLIQKKQGNCFDIVPVHFTNEQGGGVRSVYIQLNVDGRNELAFLDTGIEEVLIRVGDDSSAYFLTPEIRGNSGWKISINFYRAVKSTIAIGLNKESLEYKSYSNTLGYREKYVVGAGIFDRYSLYLDLENSYGCLLDSIPLENSVSRN